MDTTRDEPVLPNFCDARVLLLWLLAGEALAVVLVLHRPAPWPQTLAQLGLVSLFVQTVALLDAALLCALRERLRGPIWLRLLAAWLALQAVCAGVGAAAQAALPYVVPSGAGVLARQVAISALITGLLLRYSVLADQVRRRARAESEARLAALHARIRPHFLFNSLNTIAALIPEDPPGAEAALLDLAELFRRALGAQTWIPLDEELALLRRYLALEQRRLGERLRVDWRDTRRKWTGARVPALLLQPLVENAVYHGIEPSPAGGTLKIDLGGTEDRVRVVIENPVPGPGRSGNRSALALTRERLELAYAGRARLAVSPGPPFRVELELPTEEGP